MTDLDKLLEAIPKYKQHQELTVKYSDIELLYNEIMLQRDLVSYYKNEKILLQARINLLELDKPVRLDVLA